jgi:hypothetical protein
MHYGMKIVGLSLLLALLAFASGTARAAELPSALLERVTKLQQSIAGLEQAGQINHGQASVLNHKLNKVSKVLSDMQAPATAAAAGDVTAQQQGSFLGELQRAIEALLDFIQELTQLVTELPAEVVQPIIDAAIELLRGLIGLLLG